MRLLLSLEKRNKKGESGPHDHEDEASSSLQELPTSWMTSIRQVAGYLTALLASM